jgi:hypothetical protein
MIYQTFMKYFVVVILLVIPGISYEQTKPATVGIQDSTKAHIAFLIGCWKSNDSALTRIEFRAVQNELKLLADNSYTYEFLETTGFPFNGTTISWPPHDCLVKKLDKDHIEIQYTLFGGDPVVVKYKKVIQAL